MTCAVRASHDDEPSLCPTCILQFMAWIVEKYGPEELLDFDYGVRAYAAMEARVREFVQYRTGV